VSTLPQAAEVDVDALKGVTKPTLVAALDEDPLFPLADTCTLYQSLPNARFAVLPSSQHAFSAVPLDALAPLVHDHLTSDRADRG